MNYKKSNPQPGWYSTHISPGSAVLFQPSTRHLWAQPHCHTSLVVQNVKNLPAMQKTWVQSLSKANHSSIFAWRSPKDRGAWQATVHGVTKSWTRLSNEAQHSTLSQSRALHGLSKGHSKFLHQALLVRIQANTPVLCAHHRLHTHIHTQREKQALLPVIGGSAVTCQVQLYFSPLGNRSAPSLLHFIFFCYEFKSKSITSP